MIISHKYKFIFFAVPKTATHAIRFALRPHLGPDDEEHVFQVKNTKFNIPEFQDRKNGHFTVDEIKPHISDEVWNSYYKFSFVRNPFDRFISLSFFHFKALKNSSGHINQLLIKLAKAKTESRPEMFKSQTVFLYENDRQTPMDFIGRFENIQSDFNKFCDLMNIPATDLQEVNSSNHKHYLEYYQSNELRELVQLLYEDDIHHFNYTLDSYSGSLPMKPIVV